MSIDLSEQDIRRILNDLLNYEITKIRGRKTDIDFSQLDSLEYLAFAASVNEFFHLFETGIEDNLLRYKDLNKWIELVDISWKNYSEHISFKTSGSSGVPKTCVHETSLLAQEAIELSTLFFKRKRVLSFVPCHHIYGFLFTILLPKILDVPMVQVQLMGIGKLKKMMMPTDLIVAIPVYWSYLDKSVTNWKPDIMGVTSTAPCDPLLIKGLLAKGLTKMYEVYGSSENGGIGYRDRIDQPYKLFSFWKPYLKPTPELGYETDPELIRLFPDDEEKKECPVSIADVLIWKSDREFLPIRRKDLGVQVGGINVYPIKIADKIREHPYVADCLVRLSNRIERLKAFIVLHKENNTAKAKSELEKWIYRTFQTHERPVHLTFGKKIPTNQLGKPSDWMEEDLL